MAASTSSSWMPTQGRHQVSIGSSLGRALKTRKQGGTPPATNPKRSLPDKDFYSFRYTFKPESIDPMKPGTIEVRKKADQTSVVVEHLGSQAGEAHVFTGNEIPSKEWECVLIYDEETGTYTLEKLDSSVKLQYERKRAPPTRTVSSAPPSPMDQDAEGEYDNDEDLEKELLGLAEDIPPPKPPKPKQVLAKRPRAHSPVRPPPRRKEEEKEANILPPRDPTPPPPPPPVKPPIGKVARPSKSAPKRPPPTATKSLPTPPVTRPPPPPIATPPVPAPASTVPQAKAKPPPKKKAKKEPAPELLVVDDPDVEVLEFGKRAKASMPFAVPTPAPAPPKSAGFALPGSLSSFVSPLPAPPSAAKINQRVPPVSVPTPDEDSDEEWEEVAGAVPTNTFSNTLTYESDDGGDLFGEDEMEDALAQELDLGMNELDEGEDDQDQDQDFLAEALTKDDSMGKIPMSLNNYAVTHGLGGDMDLSDEDFTSSEESDED